MAQSKEKRPAVDTSSVSVAAQIDIEHIRALLQLLAEHHIHEFEFCHGDLRIRIVQQPSGESGVGNSLPPWLWTLLQQLGTAKDTPSPVSEPAPVPASAESTPSATEEALPAEEAALHYIRSPIVGTFYRAPAPDAPPFVEVGDRVRKGQTVCIIEAMKIMNEIQSDVDGEVVAIYVANGAPVEYGERLMAIRPSAE